MTTRDIDRLTSEACTALLRIREHARDEVAQHLAQIDGLKRELADWRGRALEAEGRIAKARDAGVVV